MLHRCATSAGTCDIAHAAGVDARLVTRYFGSKERLFALVVEEIYMSDHVMIGADAVARKLGRLGKGAGIGEVPRARLGEGCGQCDDDALMPDVGDV